MSAWADNTGTQPKGTRNKRVIVELANGRICGEEPVSTVTPKGWAADGKFGCRWSLENSPFDIRRWRRA